MMVCSTIIFRHKASHMQKLASITSLSLTVCCIGFLIRIESNTIEGLIAGQKVLYAFITYGMFFMLLFIFDYCKVNVPKIIINFCYVANIAVTIMVLTLDHHELFYKSYWTVLEDGYAVLEKEYGIGHSFTVGLFILYMVAAFAVATWFSARNIKKRADYVGLLMIAVSLPCLSYIIPKLTGWKNDLQPLAFAGFTVLTLIMIYKNNLYDINNIAAEYSVESMDYGIVVFDKHYRYKGCNGEALSLFPELANISVDADISKDMPLLKDFLDGKYEYFDKDENKYSIEVKEINDSEGQKGKVLWLEDITVEYKYNEMMKAQQESLKSEVGRLNDISYKDDLTSLYNRRYYEECIATYRETKDTKGLTIIALDLNGLKKANDELGHAAGDELIVACARLMQQSFDAVGKCFRSGGDEFFIIMDKNNPVKGIIAGDLDKVDDALTYNAKENLSLEDLLTSFENAMKSWKGELVDNISISYGVVNGYEHEGQSIDELMILADAEMYKSKEKYYQESGISKYR